ncbi:MAG TPA: efflux RND transporter periplasmic adaptor subunit [Bacteroidales bacterium]|nr:efflux RND transporter periplasmic adaptor subunit [Bacteroidales bacterium]
MKSFPVLSLALVASLLIAAASCSTGNKKSDPSKATADTLREIPVKTTAITKETITRRIEFTATLNPFEEVHLAPASPGRIEKINVEISDHVKQGQVVALMDRTNLQQAQINLMKVKADFRRFDTLKKTRSIADQQYDQMKSAYDIAENSYNFLLDNTQLKAPFNGVISGKYFEDGEIYSGSPVAAVGKPAILSIVQIDRLKALIGISAGYFPLIRNGMKAEVTSDIYPGRLFSGEIFRIYPTIDNTTKTFTAELKIPNEGLTLRPGMFAKIRLDLGKGEALLVPTIALIKQTGTNDMYVFVNKNGKAVKTAVKIGTIVDDRTEILEGLSNGDEIVTSGQNKLVHQSPLKVIR